MLISTTLAQAINAQVGNEFGASLQYLAIADHFRHRQLTLLTKLFTEQAAEEREHALKFVQYLADTRAALRLPAIPSPTPTFASAEEAVQAALAWEQEVTRQITGLMRLAEADGDYLSQGFLQWFIDEQREEVVKMSDLLGLVRQAGERNLLTVEAYLVHAAGA